jgi:hypothetical protein
MTRCGKSVTSSEEEIRPDKYEHEYEHEYEKWSAPIARHIIKHGTTTDHRPLTSDL